jgi:hypothetical protein
MKYKIFSPIRFSDILERLDLYETTLNEIETLDNYMIFVSKKPVGTFSFRFANQESEIESVKHYSQFGFPWADNILITDVDINISKLKVNKVDPLQLIEKRFRGFITMVIIAKLGVIDTGGKSLIVRNNVVEWEIDAIVHSVCLATLSSLKYKWPPLIECNLDKTIDWFREYESALDVMSENRIGRAINAFSYIIHEHGGSDDPAIIFWALLGIEAIYAEGTMSIQAQVNLKSQTFLGERIDFKKKFNEMYDFRSRYIHGDLNFPNKNFLFETNEDFSKHFEKFCENRDFAICILLGSLQKLIKEERHFLEFEYTIKSK